MPLLRLDELQARVVAWHNRHPLARRIRASQVHSIGEVALPFASAQPASGGGEPPVAPPTAGDAAAEVAPTAADDAAAALPAATHADPPQPPPEPQDPHGGHRGAAPGATLATDPADEKLQALDPIAHAADGLDGDRDQGQGAAGADEQDRDGGHDIEFGDDEVDDDDELQIDFPDHPPGPPAAPALNDPALPPEPTSGRKAPHAEGAPAGAAQGHAVDGVDAPPLHRAPDGAGDSPFADLDEADRAEAALQTSLQEASAQDATAQDTPWRPDIPQVEAPQPSESLPAIAETASAAQPPGLSDADTAAPLADRLQAARQRASEQAIFVPPAAAVPPAGPTRSESPGRWWQPLLAWAEARRRALPSKQPSLRPAFDPDFLWPLSARRVARWASRHGAPQSLSPVDWPVRRVEADPQQMQAHQQRGRPHAVTLHLLTAGIGVGDRRIRLLLDGHGAVLGPRAYDLRRVAAAVLALVGLLTLAGAALRPPAAPAAADAATVSAQASPADPAASAAAQEVVASQTDDAALVASADATDSAVAAEIQATESNDSPGPTVVAAPAPAGAAAPPAAPATDRASATPDEPAAPLGRAVRAPARPTGPPQGALGRIRPELSAAERLAARERSQALRAGATGAQSTAAAASAADDAAPPPVYAVVTLPDARRAPAEAGLAQMRAAGGRLPPPVPARSELMLSGGQWRAAWWPFGTLADAERARVMLIGRGLRTEVVVF